MIYKLIGALWAQQRQVLSKGRALGRKEEASSLLLEELGHVRLTRIVLKWKTKLVKYSTLRPAKAWIPMCRFGGLGQGNKQRIQRRGIRLTCILCICSY